MRAFCLGADGTDAFRLPGSNLSSYHISSHTVVNLDARHHLLNAAYLTTPTPVLSRASPPSGTHFTHDICLHSLRTFPPAAPLAGGNLVMAAVTGAVVACAYTTAVRGGGRKTPYKAAW